MPSLPAVFSVLPRRASAADGVHAQRMEPTPRPATAWYKRLEVWVFAVTLLLRLVVLSRYAETPYFSQQTGDMKFYDAWANRILEGQFTEGHAFYGLPGYAWVLAGIYK